jgi:hypothetical protein
MHPKPYIYEHFDIIINLFKYKYETSQIFIYPLQKIVMNARCNSWEVDFNYIQSEWFNSCANVNRSEDAKKQH